MTAKDNSRVVTDRNKIESVSVKAQNGIGIDIRKGDLRTSEQNI